jgi:UDP-glucose 4-epimerase
MRKAIVTGGAGFIGSHVVDELLSKGMEVTVIDDMRSGQPQVVEAHRKHPSYRFVKLDLLKKKELIAACKGADFVFHLAANADIRGGMTNTSIDLEQNVLATHNVLEAMRLNDIKGMAFTSSAAVYGTQKVFPTTEDTPKKQTSLYGASKIAAEAFIEAYSEYYGFSSSVFRFVSIIGERYPHGVVIDFYRKLKADPKALEILGDGKQKKSFLYVKDCVAGMMLCAEKARPGVEAYNLGQNYTVSVTEIADMVVREMGLRGVEYRYAGGEIGWVGDQPMVLLSTKKIESLGWKPTLAIEEGVRRTVCYLMKNV